ncbi:SDR family oxidoreductase [Thiofilum flexile]|uniref:SDR family oxidoreductase n=1 Tax=Thiofilum flexile TaxID=125627 RepID=UPI00037E0BA4|nr:SDR family oxidoreductase [Thiofilum flexile]
MKPTRVLILGANGAIAQHVIQMLQDQPEIQLTLFLRSANSLPATPHKNTTVVIGDVLNPAQLNAAIRGQDIVYANLAGSVDKMAQQIVESMQANQVKRLIFITSLGIYHEIPGKFGEWNQAMIGEDLVRYRHAADIIEASPLDYTVVRPSWLTDNDEVAYETTQKGQPFIGTEVARKAVAAYITDLIEHPEKDVKASVGVNKPGVYGDKPSFY